MVIVGVKYEWKPTLCTHCKGLGHLADVCKKKEPRKSEWVVKKTAPMKKEESIDADGFVKVVRGSKQKELVEVEYKEDEHTNVFAVLEEVMDGGMEQGETSGEGGVPALSNG